jgi:hypothetical protein
LQSQPLLPRVSGTAVRFSDLFFRPSHFSRALVRCLTLSLSAFPRNSFQDELVDRAVRFLPILVYVEYLVGFNGRMVPFSIFFAGRRHERRSNPTHSKDAAIH